MRSMKIKLTILFNLVIHLIGLVYLVLPNSIEHKALLAIKSEINYDPNHVLSSWNDPLHYCDWEGIICGTKHPQRVVGIALESKELGGTLSPYVGNLSFLHHIFLFNNSFQGNIPPTLGRLSKLQCLRLTLNSFNGPISANMSHCLNLKRLGLGFNHLSGTIPYQLSRLVNLELLALSENNLTGELNVIVKNMTSLQILDASDNLLQGSIPQNIGEILPRLVYINLMRNKISGIIPNSFYNLSHLQKIGLSSNQLQGTLPLDIGIRLPQLTAFLVDNNSLQGNLPTSLSNLTLLQILMVGFNNFTGKLNFSAINTSNLLFFVAIKNYLGTAGDGDLNFIQTFLNCTNLKSLALGHNNFGGSLPDFLGNFSTKIHILDLQFNKIVGSIPIGLFNLFNLQTLNLRGNHLTGQLSPQIGKLAKLETLFLSINNLSGRIPNSIGNLSYLIYLMLYNNKFHGTIPPSLGQCKYLLYMYLQLNNLSGTLSPLLFTPSSMIVELVLAQNHLRGIIPTEIGQIENLNLLDLSSNAFIGTLPSSLSKCTFLDVLDLRKNFFIESIPQSFKSLTSLSYIDLSYNNFSGSIPDYLIKFPLMELDLSYNNFVGEIPTRGVFANQSAFDISGNKKLCGGIPQLHLPRCPPKFSKNKKKHRLSIAVILIIVVASFVVTVSILKEAYLIFVSRRKSIKSSQGSALSLGELFSKLSYDMLSKATNGFSEENLLGIGHFGSVYKGILDAESNMVVAVKVFRFQQKGAAKSFMVECEALRNTRHRNLLKIRTVCSSIDFQGNDFKALVYEFMPNGNLHQWIHSNQQQNGLSLSQRLTIALDVACAVDYLHNDCEVPIIHCDLKPSNILLDADMVAHVGDFGLARFDSLSRTNNSSTITIKGTVGYADPEYGLGMAASKEGDLYSFGIILIELMTAKSPTDAMFEGDLDLHKYAQSGLLSDELINIIDPSLLNNCGNPRNDNMIIECIGSVIEIGVKCSAESPQNRMRIEDAISELKKARDIWLNELRIMDRYA